MIGGVKIMIKEFIKKTWDAWKGFLYFMLKGYIIPIGAIIASYYITLWYQKGWEIHDATLVVLTLCFALPRIAKYQTRLEKIIKKCKEES
jgi:hypothetical protein